MATVQLATDEQRFVLTGVEWKTYLGFLNALDERHIRVTYDRGTLELMTTSHLHERYSELLGQLIQVLTEELNMPRISSGSTTLKRKKKKRGLEPDKCFYFHDHEALVRDKDQIDLRRDPPPDLAIEIEISRSDLDRMGIYAALGILEVWRFDGQTLQVHRLTTAGTYAQSERSGHFPFLPLAEVVAFLHRRTQMDETSLVRSFREWVRQQIASG